MLFSQRSTWEELQEFMEVAGLKRLWIADKCDIPRNNFYSFCSGGRALPDDQERRLVSFMAEYREANAKIL